MGFSLFLRATFLPLNCGRGHQLSPGRHLELSSEASSLRPGGDAVPSDFQSAPECTGHCTRHSGASTVGAFALCCLLRSSPACPPLSRVLAWWRADLQHLRYANGPPLSLGGELRRFQQLQAVSLIQLLLLDTLHFLSCLRSSMDCRRIPLPGGI